MYFGVVKKIVWRAVSERLGGKVTALVYVYEGGHLAIRVKSEQGLYSMRKVYFSDLTLAILFRLDGVVGTFCLVYLRVFCFSSRNTFVETLTLLQRSEESRISTVADWHSCFQRTKFRPQALALLRNDLNTKFINSILPRRASAVQAIELERQHAGHELEVSELHAYTMAIVEEVSWSDWLREPVLYIHIAE